MRSPPEPGNTHLVHPPPSTKTSRHARRIAPTLIILLVLPPMLAHSTPGLVLGVGAGRAVAAPPPSGDPDGPAPGAAGGLARGAAVGRGHRTNSFCQRTEKLLRGLGEEIDALLDRSERAVRQHAVAAYRKSKLSGRAELAAFFLEDLVLPPEPRCARDRA